MAATAASASASASTLTIPAMEIVYHPNPYIIIVGMGLAGQVVARRLLEMNPNTNIILIENRAEFTRNQRLVLSKSVLRQWFELSSLPSGDLLNIKDLQMLLNTSLMKVAGKDQPSRLRIFRGPQFEITKIDGEKQILVLKDNLENVIHEIDFHYLIAADGAKHEMADLLSQNPKYAIFYDELPKVRHQTCASIAFKLRDGVKIAENTAKRIASHLSDKTALKQEHLDLLKKLHWEEAFLPITYIARDSQNIFYMIGEVPSGMGVEDRQAREEWAKTILSIEYAAFGLTKEDFVCHSENAHKINPTFKLELKAARRNVMALGKKGGFFLIGDARQKPNFFYGHGVLDALSDAEAVAQCFKEADLLFRTGDRKDQKDKRQDLLLDVKAILAQHQEFQDHYIALHQAMSGLLQAKEQSHSSEKANTTQKETLQKESSQTLILAKEALNKVHVAKALRFVEKCQLQASKDRAIALQAKHHEIEVFNIKLKHDLKTLEGKIKSEIKQPAPEKVQTAYEEIAGKNNVIQKKWVEIQSSHQKSSAAAGLDTASDTTTKHLKDYVVFLQEILNLIQETKKLDDIVQALVEQYNEEIREKVKGRLQIMKDIIKIINENPPPPPLPVPPDLEEDINSHSPSTSTNADSAAVLATATAVPTAVPSAVPVAVPILPAAELAAKRAAEVLESQRMQSIFAGAGSVAVVLTQSQTKTGSTSNLF